MDRFKFRFWYFNAVEEKWKLWFCDLMSVDGTCLPFNNGEGGACTDWEHEFICEQCTGLYDKNNKPIYEGDILGGVYGGYIAWCDNEKSFQMFYPLHGCMSCSGDVLWQEIVEDEENLEVIGNIHENPDLLGEE